MKPTQILQIWSNAFTLCGGCHSSSRKTFDAKLLACYTQQYTLDSGLRYPNLHELMAADRYLMEKTTNSSMMRIGTTTKRCIESSSVRHDMVAVLQPRPGPNPSAAPMKGGKGQRERTPPPQGKTSKGKCDRKGDKKEEGEGKSEGKNQWMNNWDRSCFTHDTDSDGQRRPICMRHELLQCNSQKRTFGHRCPLPKPDGTMWGSIKRSRAPTVRAGSQPRDSSRRRIRRLASGGHCPSLITSVTPQKDAHSRLFPLGHSRQIR